MSTLDEKLEQHAPAVAGLARQKFKSLKTRWGIADTDLDWKHPPELIFVYAMGYRETWRQWKPGGEPKKPDDVEYQMTEKEKSNGKA